MKIKRRNTTMRRKNNGGKRTQQKPKQQRKNRGSRKLIRKSISQRGLKLSRMMVEDERAKRQEGYEREAGMMAQMAEVEKNRERLARAQIAAEKAAEARMIAEHKYQDMVNAEKLRKRY